MYAGLVFPAQTGRSLGQILPSSTLRTVPLLSLVGAQGAGQQAAESGESQTPAGPWAQEVKKPG